MNWLAMYGILHTLSSSLMLHGYRLSLFFFQRIFPQAVNGMAETQDRITQDHARADMAHDPADFFTHERLVTMHPAVAARGLSLLKRTELQSFMGVGQEFAAIGTEIPVMSMLVTTIAPDHDLNCPGLPPHPRVFCHISS